MDAETPELNRRANTSMERFLEAIEAHNRDDDAERIARWKGVSYAERGKILAELLDLVDAIGNYPPKGDMFPGFPGSRAEKWSKDHNR
jgi:hypothetical protein